MKNKLKSLAYKALKKKKSDKLIDILLPMLLKIPYLKKEKYKQNKHPFYVVLTVDTEPGYINKDLMRKWMGPSDFQGYYLGIKVLRELASRCKAKITFLLCTHCFVAPHKEHKKIVDQLKRSFKAKHEIGVHLHPKRDFALQNELKSELKYTAAKFYSEEQIIKMLKASRNLIKKHLGEQIEKKTISFRWGNWAFSTKAVNALEKTNFKIDTSAVPGIKGHAGDDRIYDWTAYKSNYPRYLSYNEQKSDILEIPIATFNLLGISLRADPFLNSSLLINSFKKYYKNADRTNNPFIFVVITHSSEAIYKDGKKSYVVDNLEKFFRYCSKSKDVKFVTLKEAYNKYIS